MAFQQAGFTAIGVEFLITMFSRVNQDYQHIIREKLSRKLYLHSLGVARAARELALFYGCDPERAYLAGLLHDYGKQFSLEDQYREARRLHLKLDSITWSEAQLLHAPLGAELIRRELKLEDWSLIRAIIYHTTGAPGMDLLSEVVYLADYIEEGRSYPGVDQLRELVYTDLDRALLKAVENTMNKILEEGGLLHPLSVAFRNEILCRLREKDNTKKE